jgi:hypothetical protein
MNSRWLFLVVLGVVLGVAAQPAAAQDNCYEYCTGSCPSSADSYNSRSECTGNCVSRCGPGGDLSRTWDSRSTPVAPYGAIAYGKKSGATGWAYNQDSASKADQVALTNCAAHGDDCKIAIRLTHSCGAVAAPVAGSGAGIAGKGATEAEAEKAALTACVIHAGQKCEIEAWTCSP